MVWRMQRRLFGPKVPDATHCERVWSAAYPLTSTLRPPLTHDLNLPTVPRSAEELQVIALAEIMPARAVIFLGYVVSKPPALEPVRHHQSRPLVRAHLPPRRAPHGVCAEFPQDLPRVHEHCS
ncbi:hypothetical protein HYPSUDRAFT_201771 [Hypholoma sublateritium FD-334 SS-4]|uniref:Uncharacterized protein n=1 Tax=Hypholoma sublateritium (strain FD-334 SS-4) TaxID=945553 RepID=A0A0D2PTB1_HYPSF|nr:hypothetical protein HYPSUDRAFT_201771 [Hypholoma sublateritium FD-334 SS-4]